MTNRSKRSNATNCRKSIVYTYFKEHSKLYKCCISYGEKICGQTITKIKTGGTLGNLKRHLQRNHTNQYHEVISQNKCHEFSNKKNDGIQGPGSKEMLGILNEEDSGSEAGGDGDYFGRTSSAKFDISIPEELKYVLVSDWDLLTHKKSLFSLPAKITVANILTDYIKNADKLASDGKNSMTQIRLSMIKEVAHGIKGFFDAFIGTQLLYNNERVQFHDEILKDTSGKAPSDIYGSAHLLRLMVRIGGLLDRYNIREESDVRLIEGIISDFLQYLEVNRTKYFTSKNYVEATDEYLAKAFSGSMDPVN